MEPLMLQPTPNKNTRHCRVHSFDWRRERLPSAIPLGKAKNENNCPGVLRLGHFTFVRFREQARVALLRKGLPSAIP